MAKSGGKPSNSVSKIDGQANRLQNSRRSQFIDFLEICARSAGARNADHFISAGIIEDKEALRQAGAKFLALAMGFDEREWIPYIVSATPTGVFT